MEGRIASEGSMCCFSKPVRFVGSTKIFARFLDFTTQCIVYEMRLDAAEELAMILPIPVAQPAKEDAVKFTDFSGYSNFFMHLENAFPEPPGSFGEVPLGGDNVPRKAKLQVQRVGSFDASFVPTTADFSRLDERFRLEDSVWKSLPQYKDYGFAVFKLRQGDQLVHPMAFRFPSALPGKFLYFPTVHIHDGKVHETEDFDHTLYAQAWKNAVIKGPEWQESEKNAGRFVNTDLAKDIVWGGGHLYKRNIHGRQKNEDILAAARKLG